jgi:tRNA A-37 threonylcarbamoyl transferase component Bud32
VQVVVGSFSWAIAPRYRDILLGPDGLRLAEWLQAGQAHIVKNGPHRIVYRVELPELCFYVKRNLVTDRLCWARQLIRRSKARTEHERASGVAARGLPTYQPLAFGEERALFGSGESILITRSLDQTQELHMFAVNRLAHMPTDRQAKIRQRLAVELGKLVARMHDAGICHDDLHPANILVRLEKDDRLALYLIDLGAVRLGRPLSWKQSQQNLVILNRWFVLRASRSDRYRFWKTYCRQRRRSEIGSPLASCHALDLADDLERQTLASNLKFWQRRDKRCLKNNHYYQRVDSPRVTGHAVMDLDASIIAALEADPDAPFSRPGAIFLKNSPSSKVIEMDVTVAGRPRTLVYKRFSVTSWSQPLAALFRPAAALRSWMQGQGFRERGLPTARPLAVLFRRRLGLRREGYLLTEKIDNAQDLHRFLASLHQRPAADQPAILRRQIGQVATVIRELHRRRLSHRDLKAANILVSRDSSSFFSPFSDKAWTTGTPSLLPIFASSVWLIDLVGVRRYRWLSRRRKIQNLARLNASFQDKDSLTRSDRLRFLRTYLRWNLHGKGDWKRWWQAIARATEDKISRNQKRGRPLA